MDSIRIRPMTIDDSAAVAAWMVETPLMQCYRLTVERARQQFETALAQHDIMLVADAGEHHPACGFAWCLPKGGFGRSVYLRLIGVKPDLARAGIGAALLTAAEQAALDLKSDLILLVSDFNVDAQRFYQRQGYQQIGAIPGYVLPDVSELIYWKPLPNNLGMT